MNLDAPSANEIEVSVFGRGFGEAICVHLGCDEWMLVDSCLHPAGLPAGLWYLQKLGLPLDRCVKVVVATHWHDDHVAGLGRVVDACAAATVVCSAALYDREIFAFVVGQQQSKGKLSSGVDELAHILATCATGNRHLIWAKANIPVHPQPPGRSPAVVALSPSENAFERALHALIKQATGEEIAVARRFAAPEGPNGSSVVTWVWRNPTGVLLGADLETTNNPDAGWDAVLTYSAPPMKSSLVKIPHHGSDGAHHDRMWTDLLESDPLAILTPWINGARHLPTDSDINRIKSLSSKLYITSLPSETLKKKKDPTLRKVHGAPVYEVRGWGHVRARRRVDEQAWRIELDGDAVVL